VSDPQDTPKGHKAPKTAQCTACGTTYAKAKQIEFVTKRVGLPQEVARMCPACRRKAFLKETEEKLLGHSSVARR